MLKVDDFTEEVYIKLIGGNQIRANKTGKRSGSLMEIRIPDKKQ